MQICYTPTPEPDFIDAAMLTCLQIHEEQPPGGVLVFLPGQDDIESLQQLLEENLPFVTGKKAASGSDVRISNVISEKTTTGTSKSASAGSSSGSGSGGVTKESDNQQDTSTTTTDENTSITVTVLQDFEIMPLYAAMPPDEQLKVFSPMREGVRRFILSTNIAETSVTISGIKYGEFY